MVALTPMRPMRAGRVGHAAIVLEDGRVLVVGGVSATGRNASPIASCEAFEPSSGLWRVVSRLLQPRQDLALVRLADGRVLALGGRLLDRAPMATVEAWDPRTDRWERLPDLAAAVSGAAVATIDRSRALVIGGFASEGPSRLAWWIDLRSGVISAAPSTGDEHAYHAVAVTPDGAVFVSGISTEILRDDCWARLSRPHGGADAAAVAVLEDGSVVIAGGRDGEDERARADTAVWPSGLGNPVELAFEHGPRWGHTMARLRDGRLVAAGGITDGPRFVEHWELLEPTERRWRPVPTLVETRWRHAQVEMADGAYLLVGGARSAGPGDASPAVSKLDVDR